MNCRFCDHNLVHPMINLGYAPPSNALLTKDDLDKPETYYPLRVKVCHNCWLVQTEDFVTPEAIFNANYPYFSSTSNSYLKHASNYADMITKRLGLNENSLVIEIGSNDGYMLKNFMSDAIPCCGIEPARAPAVAAQALGITVLHEYFGAFMAHKLSKADLIIANNVYAHTPDIHSFTEGLKTALKPGGTITMEFPHLLQLMEETQFDTIYHEHFSYFSLRTVWRIIGAYGLRVYDAEEIPVHGGSLRVYICHADDNRLNTAEANRIIDKEIAAGLFKVSTYEFFQKRVDRVKDKLLDFLIACKRYDWTVAGFGAAAKGNTLLNYAGVKPDLLPFIADDTPAKQGKYMPGSHIPILPASVLNEHSFDYLLVLPWNFIEEITARNADLVHNGTKLVTAIPRLKVFNESATETTDQLGRANVA